RSGGIRIIPTLPQPAAPSLADAGSGSIGLAGQAPVAWQSISGQRSDVSARYKLDKDGTVSLEFGEYDTSSPLTVTSNLAYFVAPPAAPAPSANRESGIGTRESATHSRPLTPDSLAVPLVLTPTILGPFP